MNNEYAFLARKHRQFEAVEDMNEAVRQHIYNNKSELTKSAISVLNLLAKYAVKFKGVAFLKFSTLMEKTELSRSTIIRSLNKLKSLGIISKQHVMRTKSGGNGANLYVINDFQQADIPSDTPKKTPCEDQKNTEKTDLEALLQKAEAFNSYKANSEKEYVSNKRIESVYDRFKKLFVKFSKDDQLLYKCYGVYLANIKWLKGSYSEEELLETALYSIKTTFQYGKKRVVNNFAGLFHKVLNGALDRLYESYALEWSVAQ
jgi:DNA-binding Lrp family transcriptional regulator